MIKFFLVSLLIICTFNTSDSMEDNDNYTIINYTTEDGGLIEASFFDGKKDLVVIFAHGGVFNKKSCIFLQKNCKWKEYLLSQ